MPGIVSGLHAHPNCGAVAKQLAEPNRNRRRNRLAFAQNVMEMPAGNTEKRAMRFSFRQRSVTDGATFPLTSVPITVTSRASRSSTGASGCDPDCGASAAPAGGVRNPAPGRLRDPARPALGPVREELAALAPERARSPFASGDSRKRGPRLSGGVRSPKREPRWSAERRARPKRMVCASEPSVARFRARSAFRRQRLFAWRGQWLDAPVGAPPPLVIQGRAQDPPLRARDGKESTKLGRWCVARRNAFSSAPAKRGRGTARSVMEGASDEPIRLRRRTMNGDEVSQFTTASSRSLLSRTRWSCFAARAPSTALRAVPLPRCAGEERLKGHAGVTTTLSALPPTGAHFVELSDVSLADAEIATALRSITKGRAESISGFRFQGSDFRGPISGFGHRLEGRVVEIDRRAFPRLAAPACRCAKFSVRSGTDWPTGGLPRRDRPARRYRGLAPRVPAMAITSGSMNTASRVPTPRAIRDHACRYTG